MRLPWTLVMALLAVGVALLGGPIYVVVGQLGTPYGVNAMAFLLVGWFFLPGCLLAAAGAIGLRFAALRSAHRFPLEQAAIIVGSLAGGGLSSAFIAPGEPSVLEAMLTGLGIGVAVAIVLSCATLVRQSRLKITRAN